jgi:hypothetical protein
MRKVQDLVAFDSMDSDFSDEYGDTSRSQQAESSTRCNGKSFKQLKPQANKDHGPKGLHRKPMSATNDTRQQDTRCASVCMTRRRYWSTPDFAQIGTSPSEILSSKIWCWKEGQD